MHLLVHRCNMLNMLHHQKALAIYTDVCHAKLLLAPLFDSKVRTAVSGA